MSDKNMNKKPKMLKMVGWYDPRQLSKTAVDVLISLIFGRHSDYRLIEALGCPEVEIQDYSNIRGDFWIDYVADLGDGWNSTYTVAYNIAQPLLNFKDDLNNAHITERGSILIFGGDAVYPVASRAEYRDRLVAPYTAALKETKEPHPDLFVTPGNHDWYDSLAAYTRLFCAKRWFAGWRTKQALSYFALKLPHHWWLIGTDIQLDSDIDDMQVKFFKKVAAQIKDNDKIILCCAEPEWVLAKFYEKVDEEYSENNLTYLEEKIFKDKIAVYLAGDLHHYRRHEDENGNQKIVAGGGGAFLHPTHGTDVNELSNGFKLKKEFPDEKTSRQLCWRNLGFLFLNPYFGFLTGLFYLLTVWSAKTDLGRFGSQDWQEVLAIVVNTALKTPLAMFWIVAVILGFIAFTDTRSLRYRLTAGTLHALSHLLAALLLGWVAIRISYNFGFNYDSTSQLILSGLLVFAGGWIVGSSIMGLYLLISLNVFGRHSNEAFSSLAICDWKNFLRLKIDTAGVLTIYPIGIKRVARKWKMREDVLIKDTNLDELVIEPQFIPDDPKASSPELIERPIIVKGGSTESEQLEKVSDQKEKGFENV